jgi:translation elongation factor EF-G
MVIPESIEFSRMTDFAERKELVRAKQRAINDGELAFPEAQTLSWRASIWELDRIVFYLLMEKSKERAKEPIVRTLAECIEAEMERLKAGEDRVSAMPLHYAIRALLDLGVAADHPGLQTLLNEVEQYLESTGRDKGGQIQRNLKKLREASAVQMPASAG